LAKLEKIVFMGTPEFGVPCLRLMVQNGFVPCLCITQPDRPKGRKKRLQPPAIKVEAEKLGIKVAQPEDVNAEEFLAELTELKPDIIITVAYGGYLKKKIRRLPQSGCLNLHPSLLPLYRGSSPINFALLNGDKQTGISIFKIVAKMDAGPLVLQESYPILKDDNFTKLSARLAQKGAEEMINVLQMYEKEAVVLVQQDHTKASFSHKLYKQDMLIDWNLPSEKIYNLVRALAEYPAATAAFREKRIKLINLEKTDRSSDKASGTVLQLIKNIGIEVATEDNNLIIKEVQPAGKKIMSAHAFNLGAKIQPGERFENGF
jgi:methionyl-tRNA formyltransferase